ncbi:MAG: deoxyribose-phosphate aldolase [Bacteroidetes bacterium]|nr:MAG: deoxyribose-phosphate aldolase [Bacteroidota bacterium]
MQDFSKTPEISEEEINIEVQRILNAGLPAADRKKLLSSIMGIIDLTTLEGADTDQKVIDMCRKGMGIEKLGLGLPNVAAVCVYPTLVRTAREALEGSHLKVAAVAGAFPAGQSPIHIKVEEVKYTVGEGADEIDMVISRGKFLEREYNLVFDEIAAIKEACGDAHLKVILETGELQSPTLIRRASDIAIAAGADFIKTSTGKIQPAATEVSMMVMLQAISDHYRETGKMVGIKPAGGISDNDKAIQYYTLTSEVLGNDWLHKDLFRIGASRLVDAVVEEVKSMK